MVRSGKNEVCHSQLPDGREFLELARLEQRLEGAIEGNCTMHGIVHYLCHILSERQDGYNCVAAENLKLLEDRYSA